MREREFVERIVLIGEDERIRKKRMGVGGRSFFRKKNMLPAPLNK